MALWPVMGMLDRISEHAVTICMLGSYRWRNNASKSCSHMQTLVHTDQADLWLGQLILSHHRTSDKLLRGGLEPFSTMPPDALHRQISNCSDKS